MTEFEKWCEENGFDPKGEFVYTGGDIEEIDLVNGDVLTLDRDDGTYCCKYKQSRVNRKLFSAVCPPLSRLTQHKTESPQFDPHTFDFRQVLPKCWVRNDSTKEWKPAWLVQFVANSRFPWHALDGRDGGYCNYACCTFEDPATEQRKTELKARAEELRAELARIEKELGE
jgi:hypothetical protein